MIEVWSWHHDRDRARYCAACEKKHKGRPPCSGCEFECPPLDPANREAWELWSMAGTQLRTAPRGIIGFDLNAFFTVAGVMGIEVSPGLLRK
ncbi:MAG: hypothetical protein DRP56_06215, partial [Planctomycetota bacterium]